MRALTKWNRGYAAPATAGADYWFAHWNGRLRWLYLLLLLLSIYVIADTLLPTRKLTLRIEDASEIRVRNGSRRGTQGTHGLWAVVSLEKGIRFQTENGASAFPIGDRMDVEVTPMGHNVVRYFPPHNGRYGWAELAGANKEYLAFPVLVAGLTLLLFIPRWSLWNRLMLNGLVVVALAAWLITLIGTGVLKTFN